MQYAHTKHSNCINRDRTYTHLKTGGILDIISIIWVSISLFQITAMRVSGKHVTYYIANQ